MAMAKRQANGEAWRSEKTSGWVKRWERVSVWEKRDRRRGEAQGHFIGEARRRVPSPTMAKVQCRKGRCIPASQRQAHWTKDTRQDRENGSRSRGRGRLESGCGCGCGCGGGGRGGEKGSTTWQHVICLSPASLGTLAVLPTASHQL